MTTRRVVATAPSSRVFWSLFVLLLLATFAVAQPAAAKNRFGGSQAASDAEGAKPPSKPRATVNLPPAVTDETIRPPRAGTEHLVAVVGGAADGTEEEKYSIGLQDQVKGKRIHGDYKISQLVDTIVCAGRRDRPLSGLFFCGHIVMVPKENFTDVKPVKPDEKYLGFVLVGAVEKSRCLNYLDQYLQEFDKALEQKGMTPGDIFTDDARISVKVCLTAYYCRDFLEKLAERLPVGGVIEAYSVPFVWHTAFHVPLVSAVVGNFDNKFLYGEQMDGLRHLKGKWRGPSKLRSTGASRGETAPVYDDVRRAH